MSVNDGTDITTTRAPQGSLAKIIADGHDPEKVPCCAVKKDGQIRGCSKALECATRGMGLPENGGFGPKSTRPGTSGEGPEYIAYYFKDAVTGSQKNDVMKCHVFMETLFDRMENQNKTGDKVIILGGPGTPYTTRETTTEWDKERKKDVVRKRILTKVCPSVNDDTGGGDTDDAEYHRAIADSHRMIVRARRLESTSEPFHKAARADEGFEDVDDAEGHDDADAGDAEEASPQVSVGPVRKAVPRKPKAAG